MKSDFNNTKVTKHDTIVSKIFRAPKSTL